MFLRENAVIRVPHILLALAFRDPFHGTVTILFHNHSISTCCHPLLHILTLRWHLFYTFRIGHLYKPCFSAKQWAHCSCPAGGATPGGPECADVQLGGCYMHRYELHECAGICQAEYSALGFSAHYCPSGDTGRPPQNQLTPLHRRWGSLHLSISVDVSDYA